MEPTERAHAFDRVLKDGELLVLPRALQQLELFDAVVSIVLAAVEKEAGSDVSEQVRRNGIEHLHEFVDSVTIERVWRRATRDLLPLAHQLGDRVARQLLGHPGPTYVADRVWFRVYVPERIRIQAPELYGLRAGFLQGTHPHRDSVFTAATNAMVVWVALGPVRVGNSAIFYPDQWGKPLPLLGYEARGLRPPPEVALGDPMTFALEAGDALLFSGEHLHSSEVNVTEFTRVSIAVRVALAPPRYGAGGRWLAYANTDLAKGRLAFAASWRSRCSRAYVEHLLVRRGLWKLRVAAHAGLPALFPDPQRELVQSRTAIAPAQPGTITVRFDAEAVRQGELRAVSETHCVTRHEGQLIAFSRLCPNDSSDLALNGHILDGRVLCGADDLEFDLRTGAAQCDAVTPLRLFDVRPGDGKAELVPRSD
jgi:nitrite reductase/ring-hydroxylating ferredoxin subunit